MSATATTPARPTRERRPLLRRAAGRGFEPGRATLDDRITALWKQLVEKGTADCPVCGDALSAGQPCADCGSELT